MRRSNPTERKPADVGPFTVTGRIQENLVRAGLNYRLPVAW
jgi:hypothetical protein